MDWDDGRGEGEAIKTWKRIDASFNHPQLDAIRWVLSLSYGTDLTWTRIDRIFREESRKNPAAALERLKSVPRLGAVDSVCSRLFNLKQYATERSM
ncbi:MAG: hypothetical protein MZU95_04975, partial [Desulfomicrobium escambiense]|nr:hypothetical protein [Desulfomicrobium escambiense]